MDADLALLWMSETGSGSARDLRERVAWLAWTQDEPVSRAATGRWLRDLSALAHAEVDWDNDRWSIASPAITRLPAADGTAILVGARRTEIIEALEAAELFLLRHPQVAAEGDIVAPAAILINYDTVGDLREVAQGAGAKYIGCAAINLAEHLPPLSLGSLAAPPAIANDTLERLAVGDGDVRFIRSPATVDGLYRLTLRGRRTHLYLRGGQWYHCDLASGVFTEYVRSGTAAMRWRSERSSCYGRVGTLFVDWGAPLPPLHARALTLCSGLTPRFSGAARTTIYSNVPELVASAVARSLSQRLHHI
jgi:hypothetical protein